MTDTTKRYDYSQISSAERILLAQELWDSVYRQREEPPLTDAQATEINRRWAAYQEDKTATSTWPQVKQVILNQ